MPLSQSIIEFNDDTYFICTLFQGVKTAIAWIELPAVRMRARTQSEWYNRQFVWINTLCENDRIDWSKPQNAKKNLIYRWTLSAAINWRKQPVNQSIAFEHANSLSLSLSTCFHFVPVRCSSFIPSEILINKMRHRYCCCCCCNTNKKFDLYCRPRKFTIEMYIYGCAL